MHASQTEETNEPILYDQPHEQPGVSSFHKIPNVTSKPNSKAKDLLALWYSMI